MWLGDDRALQDVLGDDYTLLDLRGGCGSRHYDYIEDLGAKLFRFMSKGRQ